MSGIPVADDILDADLPLVAVPDAAQRLGVPVTRVQQMLRDGQLIAVRRNKVVYVPEVFLAEDGVVKGLSGTITVLGDAGFSTTDMLRWLFTEDETLPGAPITALRGDRGREVKRRAQALAF